MIFGDKSIYAIEVYHKPLDNYSFYMAGRMCIHLYNKSFGDINEEDCALAELYMTLVEKTRNVNLLKYDFNLNNDYNVYQFLEEKLYIDRIERTNEQINIDSELYWKFSFMTNMGETFDNTKSFIYMDNKNNIHILYQIHNNTDEIFCNELDRTTFETVSNDFIKWYERTEKEKK